MLSLLKSIMKVGRIWDVAKRYLLKERCVKRNSLLIER